MIRINLLSDRVTKQPAQGSVDPAQRVTVVCSLIFVATVLAIGWQYWSIWRESDRLTQEVGVAESELARLEAVQAEVAAADASRSRLAEQVAVIEGLRRRQSGPVRMLDALSRAIPAGLWLSALEQDGDSLLVEGEALSLGALSDLIANLERSGYFEVPVEIVDGQLETEDEADIMQFQLRAEFGWASP